MPIGRLSLFLSYLGWYNLFVKYLGSLESRMPNLFKVISSTFARRTEVCISQSLSFSSWLNASWAVGEVTAQIASATKISSVWSLGLLFPKWFIFKSWRGSIIAGEINAWLSGIPASAFKAFKSNAADAPRSEDVFPVIILPSASSIAVAGTPDSSAFLRAAAITGRFSTVTLACFKSSSIL